mmetsp:Transcript_1504/g.2633  ORF Transcript_1504/g.2633 Transcript_1504/m.2633 type:complete len:203 (+) Transcript_1504:412-1020(+)
MSSTPGCKPTIKYMEPSGSAATSKPGMALQRRTQHLALASKASRTLTCQGQPLGANVRISGTAAWRGADGPKETWQSFSNVSGTPASAKAPSASCTVIQPMRHPGASHRFDKAHTERMGTRGDASAHDTNGLEKLIPAYTSSAITGRPSSAAAFNTSARCSRGKTVPQGFEGLLISKPQVLSSTSLAISPILHCQPLSGNKS